METIKRQCQVVMLVDNKKANCPKIIEQCKKQLSDLNIGQLAYTSGIMHFKEYFNQVHLYFTSDEEIKEGDYYYSLTADAWFKQGRLSFTNPNERLCKKIIASTDTSLVLPQPSTAFIEKYISEYNKGNIIEKVMIEYFKIHVGWEPDYSFEDEGIEGSKETYQYVPKVSKDNTITISKVKDSWSREKVIELIKSAVGESHDFSRENNDIHSIGIIERRFLNAWINKNL